MRLFKIATIGFLVFAANFIFTWIFNFFATFGFLGGGSISTAELRVYATISALIAFSLSYLLSKNYFKTYQANLLNGFILGLAVSATFYTMSILSAAAFISVPYNPEYLSSEVFLKNIFDSTFWSLLSMILAATIAGYAAHKKHLSSINNIS